MWEAMAWQPEEEKGKVKAVASNSPPPYGEAWAFPCVPFLIPILPVFQMQTMKDRVNLEADISIEQQPSSMLTFRGKEKKLLSLNKTPNQVPQESLGLGGQG